MDENKFSKFSLGVLILGMVVALFILINTILHTSLGSYVQNKTLAPDQMIGPKAKY